MNLFPEASRDALRLAPFQEEAVEWILDLLALRGGALLADGVGLGKSWIAAAIARVWEERGGSAEIVVPAPLVAQWRELAESFGLTATVTSHDSYRGREAPAGTRTRLVIVDEAHRLRNPLTARYRALALRTREAAVVLITATPICNSPDDLRALLGLLVADDALADRGVPSLDEAFRLRSEAQLRAVVDEIAVCREQGALPEVLRFTTATRQSVAYRPAGDHERELTGVLGRLTFPLAPRSGAALLRAFLWRRLESSVAALKATLERLRRLHARSFECALRGVAMNGATYRAAFGDRDAPMFQDLLFPELWGTSNDATSTDPAALRRELDALEDAIRFLTRHFAEDPKLELVMDVVAGFPGRRGLVFSQSRDTALAIWSSLHRTYRAGLATGGGCRDADGAPAKLTAVLELLRNGALDIVVATDVGCEGLNLQDATWVVHADLPWNPSKLEQRVGRVSRIGQSSERVDDVVLVAERSPVVAAIERKLSERRRLIRSGRANTCGRLSARLDSAHIARGDVCRCVVDLLERRSGREGRATRVIEQDGAASSLREGRAALDSSRCGPSAPRRARVEVALAVESHAERVRSRECQPAHVAASSAQSKLLDAAERAGEATLELFDALSRRYRAGAELVIAETLAGTVEARSIAMLLRVLRGEAPAPRRFEASLRGCVVTESWVRSAARLRRRRKPDARALPETATTRDEGLASTT